MPDPANESPSSTLSRRRLLTTTLAGLGLFAGCTSDRDDSTDTPGATTTTTTTTERAPTPTTTTTTVETTTQPEPPSDRLQPSAVPQAAVRGSHHPGPPRFTSVGARPIGTVLHGPGTDTNLSPLDVELSGVDGDLAPFNPDRTAEYDWSVLEAPAGSSADLEDEPVVHFEPDVAGEYRLELTAPDGAHELTVRAFPAEDEDDPQPRVTLAATLSENEQQFVIEADAQPSPDGDNTVEDLEVEFYVDDRDRDALDGSIRVPASGSDPGHTATVPVDAVTDTVRVHAVAVGDRHGVADFVRLEADGSTAHPNDPPEWAKDATVYEIFVRRFDDDVTFQTIEDRLDYLDELGIDTLWLTPVLDAHSHRDETQPGGPHGYDVIDYFQTAGALGTNEDYESLVEACHDRDIRVIFDLVINHTAREHPYFQAGKRGTNVSEDDQEFFRDLYEYETSFTAKTYAYWQGIPVVDYDSLALRSWILAVVDHWQGIVDGFRCDVAWGVPRSFWKDVRDRVKARDEEFLLLDETVPWHSDFAENQFDAHFDHGFFETLQAVAEGDEPATAINDVLEDRAATGYPEHTTFFNYVENHDVDRYLSLTDKSTQMAAGAATFTLPGAPMIYYGQETGLTETRATMNWDAIDQQLKTQYENLVAARNDLSELQSDAATHPVELTDRSDLVAYARESADGQVLVVLNFGGEPATVTVPEAVGTTDLLTDSDASVDGGVEVEHAVVLRADDAAF